MVAEVPDRLPPPPRLIGEPIADVSAIAAWIRDFYENGILSKGVVQAVDQPQPTYDPATGAIAGIPINGIFLSVVDTDPFEMLGYGAWERIAQGKALFGVDEDDADFESAELGGGEKTHTLTTAEIPSHTHVQDSHNHTQDAHTHTQNSHNHTQDAHNHTQDAHAHAQQVVNSVNDGTTGVRGSSDANTTGDGNTASVTATNQATTATNQAATATNQNATATNQATVATNQNTGGGAAHNNLPPFFTIFAWKRTA